MVRTILIVIWIGIALLLTYSIFQLAKAENYNMESGEFFISLFMVLLVPIVLCFILYALASLLANLLSGSPSQLWNILLMKETENMKKEAERKKQEVERERNKPPPDYKKLSAAELLPLAKEGDSQAQWFLGGWYVLGKGMPQDYQKAFKWYNSSAQQGYAQAQFTLGGIYFRGQYSVPQDFVLAHMWLNLASAQGFGKTSTIRDKLAEQMTSSQIQEAQKLAREFKPKKKNP